MAGHGGGGWQLHRCWPRVLRYAHGWPFYGSADQREPFQLRRLGEPIQQCSRHGWQCVPTRVPALGKRGCTPVTLTHSFWMTSLIGLVALAGHGQGAGITVRNLDPPEAVVVENDGPAL